MTDHINTTENFGQAKGDYEASTGCDYIKRENVINMIGSMNMCDKIGNDEYKRLSIAIDDIPTADVVEVVRCQDCMHYEAENNGDHGQCMCRSKIWTDAVYSDDYCSYGVKYD